MGLLYHNLSLKDKAISSFRKSIEYSRNKLGTADNAVSQMTAIGYLMPNELSKPAPNFAVVDNLYPIFKKALTFLYQNTESDELIEQGRGVLGYFYDAYSKAANPNLNRLWEISEMSKAARLRIQLRGDYSLQSAVTPEWIAKEKTLRAKINDHLSRFGPGNADSTLFKLKREYDAFMRELEATYPVYYALKSEMNIVSLTERQQQLAHDELLLSFFESNEHIHLLKVSQGQLSVSKTQKTEVVDWATALNEAVMESDQEVTLDLSGQIREAFSLQSEQLRGFEYLQIIPDGPVWNLNFAALADEQEGVIKFLGNQFRLSFRYFTEAGQKTTRRPLNSVLAFSYNDRADANIPSTRIALRDLEASIPGTSKEVLSISKLLEGDYFYAQKANETIFKKQSGAYGILHLAVHGYLNEDNPEHSYLKFAAADSLNDGKLHAYEVYNLDLNAELAVLSACHSGQGKLLGGEGMMSLGRSFAYAGVKSLLISRWEVSDFSAPFLMKYFYQGLKEGMRKSEALKFAQEKYLKHHADEITASPFFWSSFYILGDDSPIYPKPGYSLWMLWLLIPVIGLLLFFGRVRQGRHSVTTTN